VLTQAKSHYRAALLNDGMGSAVRRAARTATPEGAMAYLYQSREMFHDVSARLDRFDEEAERLMGQIEQIRAFLQNRWRWTVSFTGSDSAFRRLEQSLGAWCARMPRTPPPDEPAAFAAPARLPREALAAPLPVSYCIKLMAAPDPAAPAAPLFGLGSYLVRFDYLLPEIRLKGNAYGAGATLDDALGVYYLHSYRDPRIVETLRVFDGLRDFVKSASWSQTDVDRAIIGSAKNVERPLRPAEATSMAMVRHLRGDTNALRERRYQIALSATPASVKQTFLTHLEAVEPGAGVCVVGERTKIEEANRSLPDDPLQITPLLD
jgi:presequence protease